MTPGQYNEYQRQADVIEEEKKRLAELPKKEISDEEIEKFADEELGTIRTDFDFGVVQGMKWYREQIRKL